MGPAGAPHCLRYGRFRGVARRGVLTRESARRLVKLKVDPELQARVDQLA